MSQAHFKKIKQTVIDLVMFTLGSLIFAVSVNTFTAPNNIAAGGMTGVATMLNYLFGLPIGTLNLVMNIPLFIWGFYAVGYQFLAKTVIATLLSSVIIDLTAPIMPQYHGDPLITIVFGGFLAGFGLALILMRGGTTGGTDLLANLMGRHIRFLSLGKLILLADLAVVIASAIVYQNYESPLYAVIVIFITSKVIDAVLYGTDSGTGKMMFIISPKNKEISQKIMNDIGRGVTELLSRGGYTGIEGEVLLCAVRRQEVYKTYDIVHSIDPAAFIVVGDAGEITGEGFRSIHYVSNKKKKKEESEKMDT